MTNSQKKMTSLRLLRAILALGSILGAVCVVFADETGGQRSVDDQLEQLMTSVYC